MNKFKVNSVVLTLLIGVTGQGKHQVKQNLFYLNYSVNFFNI